MKKKYLTTLILTIILIQVYMYFNLCISYKYEVDLASTHLEVSTLSQKIKDRKRDEIKNRERDINNNQRYLAYTLLFSSVLLIIIVKSKISFKADINESDIYT